MIYRRIALGAAFIAAMLAGGTGLPGACAAESAANSCYACHARLGGRMGGPAREFAGSVHKTAGITCVTCHGGDASLPGEESMSPKHGFRGKPATKDIPRFCAGCHSDIRMMRQYNLRTDQFAEYRTSVHGKLLFEKKDTNVAVCTSCHGKHDIRRKADPLSAVSHGNVPATCGKCHANKELMKAYRIPSNQLEEFEKGTHGKILFGKIPDKNPGLAPNCATCHGIHGATPPGVREVANVCGNCHGTVARYYRESAHASPVNETVGPKCVTCHENHDNRKPTMQVFAGKGKGECGSCHEEKSKALEFGRNVRELLGGLETNFGEIQKELAEAGSAGRDTGRLKASVDAARNKLIEAGPAFHAFTIDRILPLVHDADASLRLARQELRRFQAEQRQRRTVAIYAVSVLLLIGVLLGVKLALLLRSSPPGDEKRD